jgi:post-segregation antitoxin (ccd killing protein)
MKKRINICIDLETYEKAKKLNLNLSSICNNAIDKAILNYSKDNKVLINLMMILNRKEIFKHE